jgi:hypothetical protein
MTDISGLVLTYVDKTIFGNKRVHTLYGFVGNGTDTWPAAGVQCKPANFGLLGVDYVEIHGGTLKYTYDYTNELVLAYDNALSGVNNVVVAAVVPTSGQVVRIRATGYGLK